MYPDPNLNPQNNKPEEPINQNSSPASPNVPQLENETPMDITIYPNNENASNQSLEINATEQTNPENTVIEHSPAEPITSIELPPLPPLPQSPEITNKDLNFGSIPQPEPVTDITPSLNPVQKKEDFLHNPSNQKLALIGGIVLGVLFVGGLAAFFLTTNQQPQKTTTEPTTPITLQPLPNMDKPQVPTTPAKSVLSLSDYQLKIESTYKKYQTLITSNPVSLNNGMVNVDTISYLGNEIFAISTELNELNLPDNLKVGNQSIVNEFNTLVSAYDEVVKTYKTSNSLPLELKNKFNTFTKASNDKIKILVDEVKNLKE
jgi:hypothetical protein